eukprot:gene47595-29533_t
MRRLMLRLRDEGRTSYPVVVHYTDELAPDLLDDD